MAEFERWLTGLLSDPNRLAALLIGIGVVIVPVLPLVWRFVAWSNRKVAIANRTREVAEENNRHLSAELEQTQKKAEKYERVVDRLTDLARRQPGGKAVFPEEVAETFRNLIERYRSKIKELNAKAQEQAELIKQIKETPAENKDTTDIDKLRSDLREAQQLVERLSGEVQKKDARIEQLEETGKDLAEQISKQQSALLALEERLQQQPALDLDAVFGHAERVWEKAVDAPPVFVPLGKQRPPIISVLNLKGGVGKTTVTTNLGATWWVRKLKVLLIDLDFQSSLTLRCLPLEAMSKQHAGLHVESMLEESINGVRPQQLLRRLRPIPPVPVNAGGKAYVKQEGAGYILTASENLADVETSLMIRWLCNQAGGDLRFRLREMLHAAEFRDHGFDYVLIDCPPRLTTACINALAASDLVLVPVLSDDTSLERVHVLLGWLKRLQRCQVCPNLQGVAVLRNRFSENDAQTRAWRRWKPLCTEAWGQEPTFLETFIKDDPTRLAEASESNFPAVLRGTAPFRELRDQFTNLADELKQLMGGWPR